MVTYLLFDANRDSFSNGKGEQGTIALHLEQLATQGGEPDCWSIFESETYNEMKSHVKAIDMRLIVVDKRTLEIVYTTLPEDCPIS